MMTHRGFALFWSGLASSIWLCTVGIAQAGVINSGDIVKLTRIPGTTYGGASGGGEFALFKETSAGVWEQLAVPTYCVEFNEHILLDERLVVGAVSDRAVAGGVGGGSPNGDALDPATQFLYASFATGALATEITGFARNNTWANALQSAIWSLEEEVTSALSAEAQALVDYALTYASYKGPALGTVSVLNLFKVNTDVSGFVPSNPATWPTSSFRRQDQLFYTPPSAPFSSAPEPTSAAIWLTSLALMAVRIRGRHSRHSRVSLRETCAHNSVSLREQ